MTRSHRRCLSFLIALLLSPPGAHGQFITVTLLGTGSPEPALDRFGPATLVEAGGQRLLFDVGRGAAQRLWQRSIRIGDVQQVFLTHLHSDHVTGLPDLWLSGWQQTRFGRRSAPLVVFGPEGTGAMVAALGQAYAGDVQMRTLGNPDSTTLMIGADVHAGVVYERDGVKVTAFAVDHATPPIPAYGYRVDFAGRSLVISGDTRPSESLIRAASGVDLIIHEVMTATPEAGAAPAVQRILASHTSPEDAGRVFERARPKLAVFTHVSLVALPERQPELLASLISRTRTTYDGQVVVGEDLMTIIVGDSVEVRRPQSYR